MISDRTLFARLRGIVRRGVIEVADHTSRRLKAQISSLADVEDDSTEVFEQYGFSSAPPVGSEGLLFSVGADSSHPVGINFSDRAFRPVFLSEGETCVYAQYGNVYMLPSEGGGVVVLGTSDPYEALPVARETDPVAPSAAFIQWAEAVEAALDLAGSPAATLFSAAAQADFASIEAGGIGSVST